MAIRVIALAEEKGLHCTVQQIFQNPTIDELAKQVRIIESNVSEEIEAFSLLSDEDIKKFLKPDEI
jgi:hypothetical protein